MKKQNLSPLAEFRWDFAVLTLSCLALASFFAHDPAWRMAKLTDARLLWEFNHVPATSNPFSSDQSAPIAGQKVIRGRARDGAVFEMQESPSDSIGSIYDCFDRVHALGGGLCEIQPGSIGGGIASAHNHYNHLEATYDDTRACILGVNCP